MVNKVFLGGTCGESKWRNILIPSLRIPYFNPQLGVGEWNDEAAAEELKQRVDCSTCLYVLTPDSDSIYSVAEVVEDSILRPNKTVFCFTDVTSESVFENQQIMALDNVAEMVRRNGGITVSWYGLSSLLNSYCDNSGVK